MIRMIRSLRGRARRFVRAEDGNSTIEFVLVLPVFLTIFLMGYESGMLSTRHVMLERGLERTVREVRIGKIPSPTHDLLVTRICQYALLIPDCINQMRLEMVVRDPRAWTPIATRASCVDRDEEGKPVLTFNTGLNNQLMVLRACALFDPMLPTSGLGKAIPEVKGGGYGLVATSSYVMEPFQQ